MSRVYCEHAGVLSAAIPLPQQREGLRLSPNERHDRRLCIVGSPGEGSNPFTRHLREALVTTGSVAFRPYSKWTVASSWPDVWHLNWPDAAYRSQSASATRAKATKLVAQLRFAKARGIRIAWTVHNLQPHEVRFPDVETQFWKRFRGIVDLFVHLSNSGREVFLGRFPETSSAQHLALFHPAYPVPQAALLPRYAARLAAQAGPDNCRLVVIVGRIAPYKGIPESVQAFREARLKNVRLLVAGQPTDDLIGDRIRAAAQKSSQIDLRLTFLEDDELYSVVRAADVVLLPYNEFLNSGALLLSLSLGRPVLVPSTPVTQELQALLGDGWVRTYAGSLSKSVLLASLADAPDPDRPDLADMSWNRFATSLVDAYSDIVE
jgi:beta-1,4-mannosyltransferase